MFNNQRHQKIQNGKWMRYIRYLFFFCVILSVCLIGIVCSEKEEQSEEPVVEIYTPLVPVNQQADDIQVANEDITQSRQNAITRAVARVSPAVVGIHVTQVVRQRSFFSPWEYLREIEGWGSGCIISPEGYILTNQHVVGQASEILVTMTNGEQVNAEVIGEDPKYDVALLKIDGNNFDYIPLGDSDDVIIGEWVIALGNPFGLLNFSTKPTVTVGVVSATGMNFEGSGGRSYQEMIQTDAAINSGNSGGPLVNSLGQCIGINTFIFSGSEYEGTSIGIGFAIPINRIKTILPDLQKIGKVDRSFTTGIEIDNIGYRLARTLGIYQNAGVVVSNVSTRSPADDAGVEVGDVIVAINGERVRSTTDAQMVINMIDIEKNRNMELTIFRDGKLYEVKLKL